MAESAPNVPLPVGWLVEGYRIRSLVARGGFSFVYRVTGMDGQTYALKEFFPHEMVVRHAKEVEPTVLPGKEKAFYFGLKCFFDEGRTLGQIGHPNIVRVYSLFRAFETVFLVMAFEEGASLHDYIRRKRGRLRETFIRVLLIRLLKALREIHAHKLLHLDLKPANILLRQGGDPVLIDFGSARQGIAHEIAWVRTMFTPGYAPPEQLEAKKEAIGPWTDLYALGGIVYACMTGSSPPRAEERQTADPVPCKLAELQGVYSAELLDLTAQLLALDVANRPQSAYQVYKRIAESTYQLTRTSTLVVGGE
ncbi:serine/threonine protein kinase [Hydrogenophilus thermoluteolus]|nr:serine/threonine-protein kinase [Hydrogenophilus thermoluteolus]MBW7656150.1 serine/threonine protein kinase [Hydrogenophilus thermoluteolus]